MRRQNNVFANFYTKMHVRKLHFLLFSCNKKCFRKRSMTRQLKPFSLKYYGALCRFYSHFHTDGSCLFSGHLDYIVNPPTVYYKVKYQIQ